MFVSHPLHLSKNSCIDCVTKLVNRPNAVYCIFHFIVELEHGIYKHSVVVHEHFFVDPDDEEVHTQKVENMWMRVKKKFKRQCGTSRALFDSYLKEFIFRNAHRDKTRTFTSFLARIRESYPF